MSLSIPSTMWSLVARKYCSPAGYEVIELPVPKIKRPDEVLIKMYAGAINTFDPQVASGMFKLLAPPMKFPIKIGAEGSGVVAAIGPGVKTLKVGDTVYGMPFSRPMDPSDMPGFCSDYAVCRESLLLPKPANLSFEEAAALPGGVVTTIQCINRGLELMGEPGGSLEGKTVFVSAALGAMGSLACEIFKNVYGAQKLIATASTPKVPLVKELLPGGVVDEVVDYKTQDVVKTVGAGTVDFVYDTQWDLYKRFPLAKPDSGVVVTIAAIPPSQTLKVVMGEIPFWVSWLADLAQLYYREDLEKAGEIIALGKVKPVLTVISRDDLEAAKTAMDKVAAGKGGLGKLVIKIV
ncbi:GroES-like protein [Pleurostoma richardsiae]|uniref:GroES-like protein n=1 Tax=Pleurostoma richardsiae TaxID=41990 RepID=A0AA38S6F4_9PEZI|nr:GroES-like protein [Pleurostoma richardsiae]